MTDVPEVTRWRVSCEHHGEREVADIRWCVWDPAGWCLTPYGIAIPVSDLPPIARALNEIAGLVAEELQPSFDAICAKADRAARRLRRRGEAVTAEAIHTELERQEHRHGRR